MRLNRVKLSRRGKVQSNLRRYTYSDVCSLLNFLLLLYLKEVGMPEARPLFFVKLRGSTPDTGLARRARVTPLN